MVKWKSTLRLKMKELKIRRAEKSDILNLSVLKKQVFISTYALDGIRQDFSDYITSEFSVEKLEQEINDENKIILLTNHKGFLVGCAEIYLNNKCNETNDNSPELTILYVFEHLKEKGVGFALISEVEKLVKEKGFPGLWLTVYSGNQYAINFYKRQSYKDIGKMYFEMGGEKYENRIMYKNFNP